MHTSHKLSTVGLTGKRKYVTSNTTLQFPTQTTSASAVSTSSFSIAAASDGTWNTQRVRYATGIFSNTASFWHAHHQHQCPLPFGTVRPAPASSALVSHTAASSACLRVLGDKRQHHQHNWPLESETGRPVPVSHNYFSIISPFASWAISTRRQNGTSIKPFVSETGRPVPASSALLARCWATSASIISISGFSFRIISTAGRWFHTMQHRQHYKPLFCTCWATNHRHHQHQWPRISGTGRPDPLPSASMILGRVLPFFWCTSWANGPSIISISGLSSPILGRPAPASSASVASVPNTS